MLIVMIDKPLMQKDTQNKFLFNYDLSGIYLHYITH